MTQDNPKPVRERCFANGYTFATPQEKGKITFSIFTVFTADMVEKKGAPPPVKTEKKKKQ